MPFTANPGDTVVDLASGQQFKVADAPMDLDETKYGKADWNMAGASNPVVTQQAAAKAASLPPGPTGDSKQKLTQDLNAYAQGPLKDEQARQAAEFTRLRQASALNEANRGLTQAGHAIAPYVIPAAGFAASMIPGLQGVGAQTLIGAGVPIAQQALGFEPRSNAQIGLGAVLPALTHGLVGGAKALGQKTAAAIEPGVTREAGVEAANQKMGMPFKSSSRDASIATPADQAFAGVRADTTPIATAPLSQAAKNAEDALPKTMPPKLAKDFLGELQNTFNSNPNMTIADVHKEINAMRTKGQGLIDKGETESGKAIMEARANILDEMDKISPGVKEANALYRQQQSAHEITSILRKPGPGAKVRELFENDKLVAGAFDDKAKKEITDIADQLSAIGATGSPYSGVTAKIFNVMASPLAAAMTTRSGRFLIRQTFKNGVTPQALSTVAMFGRAIEAQGEGKVK